MYRLTIEPYHGQVRTADYTDAQVDAAVRDADSETRARTVIVWASDDNGMLTEGMVARRAGKWVSQCATVRDRVRLQDVLR